MSFDPLNIFSRHLGRTVIKSLTLRRFQLAWSCRNIIKGVLVRSLGYVCQNFSAVLEVQNQFWVMACLPTLCLNSGVFCMCTACVCARFCRCVCPYLYIYRVYIYTHAHLCCFSFSRQYCLFRFVFSLDHRFCLTNFCLCKTKQKYANI